MQMLTLGDGDGSLTAFGETDVRREGCLQNCTSFKVCWKMSKGVKRYENTDVNMDRFRENDVDVDKSVHRHVVN